MHPPVYLSRKFWWIVSLITSENQLVFFQSFVLPVFWDSTSYIVIPLIWTMLMEPVNAAARCWPCAFLKWVSGLRGLEELVLFEMHTCLWPGAQILFRHKWRNLATASALLHCNDTYSCLGSWKEFFFWISAFRFKFSRVAMSRKRLQLESKSDLTTTVLFSEIFVEICLVSSISYLHGLNFALNCSIIIPFWRYQTFSIVRGVFWFVF